jgi:predicted nucleotidyltransferase
MNRKEILIIIKKTVKELSPDANIILYGSEARGESKPESDIDILILVDKQNLTYQEITAITDLI